MSFKKNELQVEPSRVHSIYFLKSLNIANVGRTVARPPEGCAATEDLYRVDNEEGVVIPYKKGITGKVVFKAGYNCQIYQRYGNTIVIGALPNQGDGGSKMQESEIPLYDGETAPKRSNHLSGGLSCEDTLKAVNGINKRNIPLIAGPGVDITVNGNVITVSMAEEQLKSCNNNAERNNSRTSPC